MLGPATPTLRSAPALPQRHDPDTDDEEGDRAGGDAGSEGLDADTDAEAEAAAAAAAEAADFDCTEEWGGDAGATLAKAPLPTPTEPRAMAELQRRRSGLRPATVPTLRSPSCQGPLHRPRRRKRPRVSHLACRSCGRADTQFGDPVTLQCQHRAGRQAGCCWHIACLRTAEERAVARRVLILPHSRYACPQHRRGVPPVGRGMGRHDDADGGVDAVSML